MVLIYSRLLILFPTDIFKVLTEFAIENRVGLKVLIDKWLLHQPLFTGKYIRNISIKALTVLYSIKDPIIESLMVIPFDPSHSNACVEVNAPFKILSVLIRCLANEILQEKVKNENYENNKFDNNEENYEDQLMNNDDFNENNNDNNNIEITMDEFTNMKDDDNTNEINSKLNFINKGKTGGLGNVEAGSEIYLSEMLVFDHNEVEGDDELNAEEDLIYVKDLEHDFVLKDFLITFFKDFYQSNAEYLVECLKRLPKKDQNEFKNFGII